LGSSAADDDAIGISPIKYFRILINTFIIIFLSR
jgi:hypothetical protein